jgi:nucleosome binding factor SPN SPT16 subunit
MAAINFKSGLFDVTMTEEEVKKMYEDMQFLQDAILMVLNPELKGDLMYTYEEAMEYLKGYFMNETNFSKDFIKAVFKS